MGKCESKESLGYPQPVTLSQLADVPIGGGFQIAKGCTSVDDVPLGYFRNKPGFSFPKNDEFRTDLGDYCDLCSDVVEGYGCECTGSAIKGRRGVLTRTAYRGDPITCCINQQKITSANNTCDPKYIDNYKTDNCNISMLNYCRKDSTDNLLNDHVYQCGGLFFLYREGKLNKIADLNTSRALGSIEPGTPGQCDATTHTPMGDAITSTNYTSFLPLNPISASNWEKRECERWVTALISRKSTFANTDIANLCSKGENFLKEPCQSWCEATRALDSGMLTACDEVAKTYCKNHPTDKKCACLQLGDSDIVKDFDSMTHSSKACWYQPCNSGDTNFMTWKLGDEKGKCQTVRCSITTGDIIAAKGSAINLNNLCESRSSGQPGVIDKTSQPGPTGPSGNFLTDHFYFCNPIIYLYRNGGFHTITSMPTFIALGKIPNLEPQSTELCTKIKATPKGGIIHLNNYDSFLPLNPATGPTGTTSDNLLTDHFYVCDADGPTYYLYRTGMLHAILNMETFKALGKPSFESISPELCNQIKAEPKKEDITLINYNTFLPLIPAKGPVTPGLQEDPKKQPEVKPPAPTPPSQNLLIFGSVGSSVLLVVVIIIIILLIMFMK